MITQNVQQVVGAQDIGFWGSLVCSPHDVAMGVFLGWLTLSLLVLRYKKYADAVIELRNQAIYRTDKQLVYASAQVVFFCELVEHQVPAFNQDLVRKAKGASLAVLNRYGYDVVNDTIVLKKPPIPM